MPTNG